jgi:hypothetical protein
MCVKENTKQIAKSVTSVIETRLVRGPQGAAILSTRGVDSTVAVNMIMRTFDMFAAARRIEEAFMEFWEEGKREAERRSSKKEKQGHTGMSIN